MLALQTQTYKTHFFAALEPPFHEDGQLYYSKLEHAIRYHHMHGICGFFLRKSALHSLTLAECKHWLAMLTRATDAHIPILVEADAFRAPQRTELVRFGEALGIFALVYTIPPRNDEDMVLQAFLAALEETQLPLILRYTSFKHLCRLEHACAQEDALNRRIIGIHNSTNEPAASGACCSWQQNLPHYHF